MTITGRQLRDARSRAQLSQEELADLLGVTHRTVGNWERGRVPAGREALIRDKVGPYLKPEGEPIPAVDPLRQYSDTALVAEIARRLDAARMRGGQQDAQAPTEKTPDTPSGGDVRQFRQPGDAEQKKAAAKRKRPHGNPDTSE